MMQSVERDGVKLCYREAAGAGPALLLIHGWCCDQGYFAPQFEHFAALGWRVVSVDLRGHGQSDKPVQDYTIAGFADDVAWLAGRIGLARPLVIGHSMGGVVACEVAGRYPDFVSGLVMLDSAIVVSTDARAGIARLAEALKGEGWSAAIRDYVSSVLLLPTDDPGRSRSILDGMSAAAQHVAAAAMAGLRSYDAEPAVAGVRVPALYIAADEALPRADRERLLRLMPRLALGQTVGSGHFCQLEVPEQVNAMLDRFIAVALRTG
jgi:pimeloyl-ACP methyl ester carboxylesterase